jgi:hypothetical protein
MNDVYRAQVDLLLRVLPHVAAERCFALKGGTAINLFVRDMPRLSVDLDLTFLPIEPRDVSLAAITNALARIAGAAEQADHEVHATRQGDAKLVVRTRGVLVKIEVNPVLRGSVFGVRELDLCGAAQDQFGRFVATPVVSEAELFGGKLVAALDRQHPRDLFDTRFILDTATPPTGELQLGFLAMLLSHDRPPHEVLQPREQDPTDTFARQFAGMSREPFSLDDHRHTFGDLLAALPGLLPMTHRRVLASFVAGEPTFDLLARPVVAELPAVRWKLANVRKFRARDPSKHANQVRRLDEVLGSMPPA